MKNKRKLNPLLKCIIIEKAKKGEPEKLISEELGISRSTVSTICRREHIKTKKLFESEICCFFDFPEFAIGRWDNDKDLFGPLTPQQRKFVNVKQQVARRTKNQYIVSPSKINLLSKH